jgi:hypothetical protein
VTVLTALAAGRAAAEAIMLDACVITRPTGAPGTVDRVTGERDPAPVETVYPLPDAEAPADGRCKVQTFEPYESNRDSGGHVYTEQRYSLHIPVSVTGIRVGDRVQITAAVSDPQLVGRTYRIAGLHHKTYATAQRLPMEEVVG